MPGLRNISISRRLWLILLASILMLIVLAGLMLKQSHGDRRGHQPECRAASLAYENAQAADRSNEAGQLNRLLGQFRV